jgi:hypothetical protein
VIMNSEISFEFFLSSWELIKHILGVYCWDEIPFWIQSFVY